MPTPLKSTSKAYHSRLSYQPTITIKANFTPRMGCCLTNSIHFFTQRSSRLTSPLFLNTFHWSTSLKYYFARSWLWSIKETFYGKSILTNTVFRNRDNLETSWISVNLVKDNDNNEKLTITIKPYDAIGMWNVFSVISSVGCVSLPQLAAFRFLSWLWIDSYWYINCCLAVRL